MTYKKSVLWPNTFFSANGNDESYGENFSP